MNYEQSTIQGSKLSNNAFTRSIKCKFKMCLKKKIHAYAYISMKIDPNGNIPPSTTMTLGSMNLNNNTVSK